MTRLHTISPTGLRGRPTLLLLHGFGADEQDLLGTVSALRLPEHWDVLSVRAPLPLPQTGGAAWFPIDPLARVNVVEALEHLLLTLDALVPEAPIVPFGFSQGAMMAGELLRARPSRIPAAVLLSGFVLPKQLSVTGDPPALAQLRRQVFFGWGEQDAVIPHAAFEQTEQWLSEHTAAVIRRYLLLGHEISPAELAGVRAFLTEINTDLPVE